MNLKTIFLLASLMLTQSATSLLYATTQSEEISLLSTYRRRHDAHIRVNKQHERSRRALLSATGYVEDDVLYLSFNLPLTNVQMLVVNGETGKTVFEGVVSGTSLPIALERDSESFEVYIK